MVIYNYVNIAMLDLDRCT